MHHPQPPSQYSHPFAPNSYQIHYSATPEPHYQGDNRAFLPPQYHTDVRNAHQPATKKVIRVLDDPHHCQWAEKKIRSLSICILGLLFIVVIQGTVQAMLLEKVYNGKYFELINERT